MRSLRTQLTLLLAAFGLLVLTSVGLTLRAVSEQAADAVLINLAGRQRMLTQRIAWLSLSQTDSTELRSLATLFEANLRALRQGGLATDAVGQSVSVPAAPDPDLARQLDAVAAAWPRFLQAAEARDPGRLQAESGRLLASLDSVVSGYESRAVTKVMMLRWVQTICLLLALPLIALGAHLLRGRILIPLRNLVAAARALGAGDVSTPVSFDTDNELGETARTLERMRREVAETRIGLENEVRQRTRELASAFDFTQEVVTEPSLDRILQSAVARAQTMTHADAAWLCLLEPEGAALILSAGSPPAPATPVGRQAVDAGFAGQVLRSAATVDFDAGCRACAYDVDGEPHARAAAALRVQGSALGALCIVRRPGPPFHQAEKRSLSLLANAAALALVNQRLMRQATHQAQADATRAERLRLAAEFHDSLAQALAAIQLQVDRLGEMLRLGGASAAADEQQEIARSLRRAQGEMRSALAGLLLHDAGRSTVSDALERLAQETAARTGARVEARIDAQAAHRLPQLMGRQLAHVAREALANVERHAQAAHIRMDVHGFADRVLLVIEDDGRGFDLQAVDDQDHHGLTLMRLRAERSGGAITIDTTVGMGTRLEAWFPVPTAADRP